jgi:hypothetical protein
MVQELNHQARANLRLFHVWQMAALWHEVQRSVGNALPVGVAMGARHQPVLLAPDDECWHAHPVEIAGQLGVIGKLPGKARQGMAGLEQVWQLFLSRTIRNDMPSQTGVGIRKQVLSRLGRIEAQNIRRSDAGQAQPESIDENQTP